MAVTDFIKDIVSDRDGHTGSQIRHVGNVPPSPEFGESLHVRGQRLSGVQLRAMECGGAILPRPDVDEGGKIVTLRGSSAREHRTILQGS